MRHIGAGYPRVVGWPAVGPGTGVYGYVAGVEPMMAPHALAVHPAGPPAIHAPGWRGSMIAPGVNAPQEGHVPLPLNPETFSGTWGTGAGQAPAGTTIIFSGRPQKPFKPARLVIRGTKAGPTAVGNLIGQVFVGTDLQQGELGNIDLESIGAATAFDTWISFKQAEPGVWIRVQATLTAFPTGTDTELYTITVLGHYLH